MMDTHLHSWFTGLAVADDVPAATVVLSADAPAEAASLLAEAFRAASDIAVAGGVHLLTGVRGSPGSADEFAGSFLPGATVRFGDGLEIAVSNYGVADFEAFDGPTALAVCDDDDFSDFLRDADRAWRTGSFAGYLTHPAVSVANLAGLGGSPDASGPTRRIFVDGDGVVRTSPWGRGLGTFDEGIDMLESRWLRCNDASPVGDASCLESAVSEADRMDALGERPFISRYVAVVQSLRGARARGRVAHQVSGFGGRITAEAPDLVDEVDAPVLAQFGAIYRAIDPVGGTQVDLSADQARTVEGYLVTGEITEQVTAVVHLLMSHGVARDWCRRVSAPVLATA